MYLPFILTALVLVILYFVLIRKCPVKKAVKNCHSPITLTMAIHHEHAKFRVRYRNLEPSQELYKIGLRNGMFGMILKHPTGMFAKTTVNGKCHFVRIQAYNYTPTGNEAHAIPPSTK